LLVTKSQRLAQPSLVKRAGRDELAEVSPRCGKWGHDWVDVLAFGFGHLLGPTTHIFDDGKGCADASSNGSNPLAEVVRCPLKAG
jgi:hypothetical protein